MGDLVNAIFLYGHSNCMTVSRQQIQQSDDLDHIELLRVLKLNFTTK